MTAPDERTPVRVVVADDHRLFRDGVRALLSVTDDLQVVGEAADADSAVALARELVPDVVLMDLHMPGGGLSATATVVTELPQVGILVLTMVEDDDSVLAAIRAGARGYVLKDSEAEDLVRAIHAVARGEAIFGRAVAAGALGALSGSRRDVDPFPGLTTGERNVLRLLARGHANAAIAAELSISHKTVRNYVSSIFTKLGVTDRAQAVVRAREAGLHRPG